MEIGEPIPQAGATKRGASLQTLERGLEVLNLLARRGSMSNNEIAAELGLHRSIVYRLLRTLEERGFTQRDAPGHYSLGLALATLGNAVRQDLQTIVQPELRGLADATRSTAFIVVADGEEAVMLASAEPRRGQGDVLIYRPTARHPLNRGAPGLAILAAGPAMDGERPEVTTGRRTGYVHTSSELTPGLSSLSAPLTLPDGPGASVGIVFVSGHVDEPRAVDLLRSAAKRISDAAAHLI